MAPGGSICLLQGLEGDSSWERKERQANCMHEGDSTVPFLSWGMVWVEMQRKEGDVGVTGSGHRGPVPTSDLRGRTLLASASF